MIVQNYQSNLSGKKTISMFFKSIKINFLQKRPQDDAVIN